MSAAASLKLYETVAELAGAYALLDESEGEWTPEIEQLFAEAELKLEAKAGAVAAKIREFEAYADAAKAEAKRMSERAKAAENQAASLKRYLLTQLSIAGKTSIVDPRFKISVRENPPKFELALLGPEKLADLRAALEADEFPTEIAVTADQEQVASEDRPATLTLDDITALDACVVVTPEQIIPESREWDKKALLTLSKSNPAAVAAVAVVTRGLRVEIK